MENCRIMIVDDEENFRKAVIHKMDWSSMGYEVVADTDNGVDALELAGRMLPDVIITDIKMPYMDGLTLSKQVRNQLPGTKVVILSGFDDFDYAKRAMKYDVKEYILKPIQSSELKEVLEKLKREIDEERNEKRSIEILHKQYLKSLPIIREKFLVTLLEDYMNENKINELAKVYELNIEASYYAVSVLKAEKEREDDYYKGELLTLSLKKIVEEQMLKCCDCHSLIYREFVIVIALLPTREKHVDFIDFMNQICIIAGTLIGARISAGIGSVYDNLVKLSESYNEAKTAIEYKVLFGDGMAISIEDVEPIKGRTVYPFENILTSRLIHEIKLGEEKDVAFIVCQIINSIKKAELSLQEYKAIIMELVLEIYKLCGVYQLDNDEIFGHNFDVCVDTFKFSSLDVLKQWLEKVCKKIRRVIRDERKDSTKMMVEDAKVYINENYDKCDLSIEKVCEQMVISAAYFSTIFKRETGLSFVSYLTKIRMEKAVELLNTTNEKTYIIADQIGYQEPNYFSFVFKKYYGVSPTKYRANKE